MKHDKRVQRAKRIKCPDCGTTKVQKYGINPNYDNVVYYQCRVCVQPDQRSTRFKVTFDE